MVTRKHACLLAIMGSSTLPLAVVLQQGGRRARGAETTGRVTKQHACLLASVWVGSALVLGCWIPAKFQHFALHLNHCSNLLGLIWAAQHLKLTLMEGRRGVQLSWWHGTSESS